MNFYRRTYQHKLHSFEDKIGDVPLLGKPLLIWQNELIQKIGGKVIDIAHDATIDEGAPYFVFDEDLFFSEDFLSQAQKLSKNKSLHFCLEKNEFNERYALPHPDDNDRHHVLGFKYIVNTEPEEVCVVVQKVHEHYNMLPDQIIKGRKYHMHQCSTFAAHIISPFHLLFVNLALNLSRTVKLQEKIPDFVRKKFGKYNGKWFYKGLKRMNVIGKNCQIHPTALIEGSVIGDNTIVGANSIVRLSHLESDCYVSDNVSVINSILGKRTCIANSNYVNSILCYPEVFLIHGPYQLSVFGENAACFAVINCDIRLDQKNIKIPTSHGILDSAQPFLGIAYGHRSKTGGGNIIASGRIVPNDLNINPPENIILGFDQ